jgi:hypothetical protein
MLDKELQRIVELLEAVLDAIETATSPDRLRRVWAPKRRSKKARRK